MCRLTLGSVLLVVALTCSASAAGAISWSVPPDGGTPRDLGRVTPLGAGEFRIRAAFEDGGRGVLRHAVSRLDLICHNSEEASQEVLVHLDLSQDGRRTDYDNRPEAGMKQRDFLFIRPPGEAWQQVDGTTTGWVATVRFVCHSGETRVGLSPWYTYNDLVRYVRSLPEHPSLIRRVAGRSDGGREQWELVITDPAIPAAHKRTIFWHAREHAYESYSSYAMEGLVEFLLSSAAAGFRQRYVIVLHLMTNVDGVSQGYEYRAGYDLPDPRGTATGRLTFETIDRLRPDFAVAWHNWVAPRDRNVVFYTDGVNGRATDRAWLRFTQLFPSLHANGHRWKDETTPLRYNWEGRKPLSEVNAHEYAMKRYGTRIWGWEMPWWNTSVDEARASGANFARAFLTTLDEIQAGTVPPGQEKSRVEVSRWARHEFVIRARSHVANPFRDAAFVGTFVSPSGRTNVVDGFYDGDDRWCLRFAPDEEGPWRYQLRGEGVEILQRGELRCTASAGPGFIGLHPANPQAFAWSDGTPFLPMGDTCYGLFDDSPITPELREEYLRTRRAQRFNFVRLTVGHSEARAAADHDYWAWGGTPERPDLDRFNPVFFRKFDALMDQLDRAGMNVELLLLNFYRRPFTDTNLWTPARERQWLRYLLARYAASQRVFLWTIANEYETHPDGRYRLDYPADVDWVKNTARFIKANDPYRHLVTVHPVISASRSRDNPRAPFAPPWRIGEFFGGDDAIDVLSQQTGGLGDGLEWDEARGCWIGDPTHVVASVTADRRYGRPVLNSEPGYEYLRGHPTERRQVHDPGKIRRTAWRIVCAGGYFAAGFHGTLGHSDVWNRIDPGNHYGFILRSEGSDVQLRTLHECLSELPFERMRPCPIVAGDAVALAAPAQACLVFLPHGGPVMFDPGAGENGFAARWLNPRSAESHPAKPVTANGDVLSFRAPDTNDWALILRAEARKQ